MRSEAKHDTRPAGWRTCATFGCSIGEVTEENKNMARDWCEIAGSDANWCDVKSSLKGCTQNNGLSQAPRSEFMLQHVPGLEEQPSERFANVNGWQTGKGEHPGTIRRQIPSLMSANKYGVPRYPGGTTPARGKNQTGCT